MNENQTPGQQSSTSTPPVSDAPLSPPVASPEGVAPQPIAPQQPPAFQPVPQASPRKSKKGWIIGGIIAGVLVLLGGGGALAYNLWYQNPDKVVHDAIINMITAETMQGSGKLAASGEGFTLEVDIDGKSTDLDGAMNAKAKLDIGSENAKVTINLSASVLYKDEAYYVKLAGVREVFDSLGSMFAGSDTQSTGQITAIIDKVDDKWISIKASDYEELSKETAEMQRCASDATKRLSQDKAVKQELVALYRENQIVEIVNELGAADGSLGYEVKLNQEKAASFAAGIENTTYGEELKKCDDSIDFKSIADSIRDTKSTESDVKPVVELWVSRFGHEVTTFTVKANDDENKLDFSFNPEFNKDISVEAPADAVSLKDLMADIEKLVKSYSADMYNMQAEPSGANTEFNFN